MPRQSTIKERGQFQFDDKRSFDFTTPNLKPAARMVDAYARPAEPFKVPMDPDVSVFLGTMENLQGAMKGGAKIYKQVQDERTERGKADAVAKKAPMEASDAYIAGHELVSGKAAAADMEVAVNEFFEANKDEDPVKFKAGLDNVSRKFMAGRSQYFIEGITADAVSIESKYTVAYQAYQTKKWKDTGKSVLTKAFDYDVNEILGATNIPVGQQAQAIREMITGVQDYAKGFYKLDRTETSSALLDVLRRKALESGNPDILHQVAVLEDQHGVRLIDNEKLAKEIDHGIQAATVERDKIRNEFDKRVEKARNRIENQVSNQIFELLMSGDPNTRAAQELIYKYSDPTRNEEGVMLNPSMVSTAYRLITTRGEGFAESTNNSLYVPLMEKAVKEGLTTKEVLDAKRFCDKSDFNSLLSIHLREQNEKAKRPTRSATRKDFESVLSNLVAEVKVVGIGGKLLDANGPTRARFVNGHMREWWQDYLEKNEGKEPSSSEWTKEMESAKEQAFRLNRIQPLEDVTQEELGQAINIAVPPPTRMVAPSAAKPSGVTHPATTRGKKPAQNQDIHTRVQALIEERMKQK